MSITTIVIRPSSKNVSNSLPLDLRRPATKGPFPLILLIHGGGWVSGNRQQLAKHSELLASEGWAVATLTYRLAPENIWPSQREDVEAALAYLVKNAKSLDLKVDRIAVAGESAGAHLSLWLAVHGPNKGRIRAVGLISPLVDLAIPMTPEGESYQIVQKALGTDDPTAKKAFSPIYLTTAQSPPTYFLHGLRDPWVPREHVDVPAAHLKQLGVPVEINFVPTMAHCLNMSETADQDALRKFSQWAKLHITDK